MAKEAYNELEALKKQASLLGISYGPNIGVDALREKVNEALVQPEQEPTFDRNAYNKEMTKLIRVRIVSKDPSDRDIKYQQFSFGNQVLGNSTYLIPLVPPASESWHLPQYVVNALRDIQFTTVSYDDKNRRPIVVTAPKYDILELPQLTKEQLSALAYSQKARADI